MLRVAPRGQRVTYSHVGPGTVREALFWGWGGGTLFTCKVTLERASVTADTQTPAAVLAVPLPADLSESRSTLPGPPAPH